jgi:NAD-dependent SIR2 family protein deacetylase
VDRLHEDAGSVNVVDLHGRFDQVICLECRRTYSRQLLAKVLEELNPGFLDHAMKSGLVEMAPDADATVEDLRLIRSFVIARCPACGGVLKPDFVYFGENVPKERVERAYAMVDEAKALLVAGSSLSVMSGLRFVRHAAKQGKPVVIINRGQTRGDDLATIKLEAGVSESLAWLAQELPPLAAA